jgi:hypothetical protein
MLKTVVLGFLAGFLATLLFHQGTVFLLHHVGNGIPAVVKLFGTTGAPFNLTPTRPFGVATVLSQSFWGGVWGILLASLLRRWRLPDLAFGAVFGAVALTFLAVTLVAWLKGRPGWSGTIPWRGLLLNGAWGWGTALLLRSFRRRG